MKKINPVVAKQRKIREKELDSKLQKLVKDFKGLPTLKKKQIGEKMMKRLTNEGAILPDDFEVQGTALKRNKIKQAQLKAIFATYIQDKDAFTDYVDEKDRLQRYGQITKEGVKNYYFTYFNMKSKRNFKKKVKLVNQNRALLNEFRKREKAKDKEGLEGQGSRKGKDLKYQLEENLRESEVDLYSALKTSPYATKLRKNGNADYSSVKILNLIKDIENFESLEIKSRVGAGLSPILLDLVKQINAYSELLYVLRGIIISIMSAREILDRKMEEKELESLFYEDFVLELHEVESYQKISTFQGERLGKEGDVLQQKLNVVISKLNDSEAKVRIIKIRDEYEQLVKFFTTGITVKVKRAQEVNNDEEVDNFIGEAIRNLSRLEQAIEQINPLIEDYLARLRNVKNAIEVEEENLKSESNRVSTEAVHYFNMGIQKQEEFKKDATRLGGAGLAQFLADFIEKGLGRQLMPLFKGKLQELRELYSEQHQQELVLQQLQYMLLYFKKKVER